MCTLTSASPETKETISSSTADGERHAGTISISGIMCRKLRRLLTAWILFSQDTETGSIFVVPQEFSMEVLVDSLGEDPVMLTLGLMLKELELAKAELVSINGMIARGTPLEQVQELLIMLDGDFTMVFVKPNGDQWTKRAIVIKPLIEGDVVPETIATNNSFWAHLSCKMEPVEQELTSEGDKDNTIDCSSTSEKKTTVQTATGQYELCLGPIPSKHPGWLQQTPLAEGDRLLAVNEKTNIKELDPEDAELTISFLFQCAPAHVSLLVWTPPSKRGQSEGSAAWRKSLRKGAIAMTGGVMVGAGAVLMVTPLHPIGHAMAFGGVGVLGTEFERPRQAAKRASAGFSNMTTNLRRSLHERRERRAAARNNKDMTPASSFGDEETSTTTVCSEVDDSLSGIHSRQGGAGDFVLLT